MTRRVDSDTLAMAQVRPQSKRQKINAAVAAGKRFVLSNLIFSVCAALTGCWMIVSWLVYRAEFKAEGANITSFADSVWWGIVTLLTVGYGDRYPVTTAGRFYAGILMFAGVLAVAIITSKISSRFLEQALREGKGIVNESKLRNHLVVCGWKEEMHTLLAHILDFNPDLEQEQLVLIANLAPSVVENLRSHPRLKGMQVVVGNYFEVENLRRAFPERARKVIILADRTPGPNGAIASMTEVDARTIMTAMSLASVARDISCRRDHRPQDGSISQARQRRRDHLHARMLASLARKCRGRHRRC
jgi:voltage-gated potassium channel